MSSSTLATIQTQLSLCGYSLCLILGNIGSCFIIFFFSQQRQSACSIYLTSLAIVNDVYLTFNGFLQIYPFYYRDGSIRAFALCKLRLYVANVLGQIANSMLILACIDRFLITSDRVVDRAFSTPRRAKWFVFISVLFWLLFCSHIAIMTTIINGQCTRPGVYSTIYIIYTIVFVALIPPIILGVFGYLAYYRLRQRHVHFQPSDHRISDDGRNRIRRQDRDLLVLVLSEVLLYVITTSLYPLMLLELIISPYIVPNKSSEYLQIESLLVSIVFIILLLNNVTPFYIYLIVSKSFRRGFKQLIATTFRKLQRQFNHRVFPESIG